MPHPCNESQILEIIHPGNHKSQITQKMEDAGRRLRARPHQAPSAAGRPPRARHRWPQAAYPLSPPPAAYPRRPSLGPALARIGRSSARRSPLACAGLRLARRSPAPAAAQRAARPCRGMRGSRGEEEGKKGEEERGGEEEEIGSEGRRDRENLTDLI
uniref:Uncharacterized protein n=1 Tax=Oryza sativa subsp. japonica TaxID=39947 RepID=Q6H8A6_ORYSJ|nr:hypothetical protein [Oryza sativa Japonica Group]